MTRCARGGFAGHKSPDRRQSLSHRRGLGYRGRNAPPDQKFKAYISVKRSLRLAQGGFTNRERAESTWRGGLGHAVGCCPWPRFATGWIAATLKSRSTRTDFLPRAPGSGPFSAETNELFALLAVLREEYGPVALTNQTVTTGLTAQSSPRFNYPWDRVTRSASARPAAARARGA